MEFANKLVRQAIEHEIELKKKHSDQNIIFKIFDPIKFLKVTQDTIDGKSTGTCIDESKKHIVTLLQQGFHIENIKLFRSKIDEPRIKKEINHQYLVINIDGKLYNESRANGLHKRVPLDVWIDNNNITYTEQIDIKFTNPKKKKKRITKKAKKRRRNRNRK